jgi:bifunctional non-homologous end joining protein LigD
MSPASKRSVDLTSHAAEGCARVSGTSRSRASGIARCKVVAPRRAALRKAPPELVGERVSVASFLRRRKLEGNVLLHVAGHDVPLTSLERVYFPDDGYTKGDLLKYYLRVGRYLMPYLEGRPAILERYPDGVGGKGFFQHDFDIEVPFVTRQTLESESGRMLDYAVYTDLASLLYLVNLGTIAQNPWHARVDDLEHPDYLVLDLDPKGAPFDHVLEVALTVRDVLTELDLEGYPKTSGSTGLHVFVPLAPRYPFEQVAAVAERVAGEVAARRPRIATVERRLAERKKDQVYVDWQQNARGKPAASVYSVRARPGATVSVPLSWREVERGVDPMDFTIATMPARLRRRGDLWKGMHTRRQKLPVLGRK